LAQEACRLTEKANRYNLVETEMLRDGNCQFHSCAASISEAQGYCGDAVDHLIVRQKVVEWLRENGDFRLNEEDPDTTLFHYLDGDASWDSYVDRMSQVTQYGDHLTLIAIAECFSCCISVVTSDVDGVNYHTRPRDTTPIDTIYLAHYPLAQHYNLLRLQGEPTGEELGMHLGEHLTTGFAYKVLCPNGQLRRIRTEYNARKGELRLGHEQLRGHIGLLCKTEPESLISRWQDSEGDLITFDTDAELVDAVRCTAARGQKLLRIFAETQDFEPTSSAVMVSPDMMDSSVVDAVPLDVENSSCADTSNDWCMVEHDGGEGEEVTGR